MSDELSKHLKKELNIIYAELFNKYNNYNSNVKNSFKIHRLYLSNFGYSYNDVKFKININKIKELEQHIPYYATYEKKGGLFMFTIILIILAFFGVLYLLDK